MAGGGNAAPSLNLSAGTLGLGLAGNLDQDQRGSSPSCDRWAQRQAQHPLGTAQCA